MMTAFMTGREDTATMPGIAQTASPTTLHTETAHDDMAITARATDATHTRGATTAAITVAMDPLMDITGIMDIGSAPAATITMAIN